MKLRATKIYLIQALTKALYVPINHNRLTPTFQFLLSQTPLCHSSMQLGAIKSNHAPKIPASVFWFILAFYNAQYLMESSTEKAGLKTPLVFTTN